MTFSEFKTYVEDELERNKKYMSNSLENENYGNALFWQGSLSALKLISAKVECVEVEPEEVQKTHNDFCWNKVKLGDKAELTSGKTGTVVELIYGENGISGMTVLYDCFSGKDIYRNCEYKSFRRIGNWVNEE